MAGGKYQQAEFAANLAHVLSGKAEPEYQDAFLFFDRTYLTKGMKSLLSTALTRTSNGNGEPVTQLRTAFGGGKTHTMLALYHLFKEPKINGHKTVKTLLFELGLEEIPEVNVSVLVGTDIDAAKSRQVGDASLKINTLWGYMAFQLGGVAGYSIVKEADENGVSPGEDSLLKLFDEFGPCVVLIDELVAYARNVYLKNNLPSGTFDSIMTFVQALTDAVKRSEKSIVIASIPESDIEIGGEGGRAALQRIEHIFRRVEALWKPITSQEGFEIVRRRLFEDCKDETGRDEACIAFSKMYSKESETFPNECKEATYLERLRKSYPIHPEVFDRLYNDWSTLDNFQRTRGVLRLMAATIHQLWASGDKSIMIMPGNIPLDSHRVRNELTGYLSDEWNGIVDSDVDGEGSEPKKVDESNSRFGASTAARRVSRTVFLGSAPSSKEQKNRGLEDLRIMLGVIQPEENVSVFKDALSTLSQRLSYLYSQGNRYWFDSHPNLRKTVEDRANRFEDDEVYAEVVRRLHLSKEKGDFAGIHICPDNDYIEDDDSARLVVLSPVYTFKRDDSFSRAIFEAKKILNSKGSVAREYRNMLVFLAADTDTVAALYSNVRTYLAWQSIVDDKDALNLDAHQTRQANESLSNATKLVDIRLNDTYSWLLVPTQDGEEQIQIEAKRITKGDGNLIIRASKQARSEELLITKWSPALLKNELDKRLWSNKTHVGLKQLWQYFASYPYLPRLKDSSVLIECIKEGIRSRDYFGYASSVSESGKFLGLEFGNPGARVLIDNLSVMVERDHALKQIQEEEQRIEKPMRPSAEVSTGSKSIPSDQTEPRKEGQNHYKKFYGIVELDPIRVPRDAAQIAEEIIQHLLSLSSSDLTISLEIKATASGGIPEKIARTIIENCKALNFKESEFEN